MIRLLDGKELFFTLHYTLRGQDQKKVCSLFKALDEHMLFQSIIKKWSMLDLKLSGPQTCNKHL